MKRLLSFFFLACSAFFIISCGKESLVKNNIEGTWGLTHGDYWEKTNGMITSQESIDLNPYAPEDQDGGMKFVIINTVDNKYLVSEYDWWKSAWVASDKYNLEIKGNKIYCEGEEGSFSLSSETLVLEKTSKTVEEGKTIETYLKYVFRKMSDLTE